MWALSSQNRLIGAVNKIVILNVKNDCDKDVNVPSFNENIVREEKKKNAHLQKLSCEL